MLDYWSCSVLVDAGGVLLVKHPATLSNTSYGALQKCMGGADRKVHEHVFCKHRPDTAEEATAVKLGCNAKSCWHQTPSAGYKTQEVQAQKHAAPQAGPRREHTFILLLCNRANVHRLPYRLPLARTFVAAGVQAKGPLMP